MYTGGGAGSLRTCLNNGGMSRVSENRTNIRIYLQRICAQVGERIEHMGMQYMAERLLSKHVDR
jgi:hypothetical protein